MTNLKKTIIDEKGDAFDQMMQHRSTAHEFRMEQKLLANDGELPSELSKADQQFDDALRSDALGVRHDRNRDQLSNRERELADLDLSDPFGIRNGRSR